jgi:hypothetical protein
VGNLTMLSAGFLSPNLSSSFSSDGFYPKARKRPAEPQQPITGQQFANLARFAHALALEPFWPDR